MLDARHVHLFGRGCASLGQLWSVVTDVNFVDVVGLPSSHHYWLIKQPHFMQDLTFLGRLPACVEDNRGRDISFGVLLRD